MQKILIIEDNEELRENLEEILELYGYEVTTAADGTDGVNLALKNPPNLILCDVMMPKLDGFGVLNILSKKPATANIPFVFLTAKTEKEDLRRGMNLGADDYIFKPFFKDDLLKVVETRLAKSERIKQQFDKSPQGWSAFINEAKGYDALKDLSESQLLKTYNAKEVLFDEDAKPRYLFFVKSGQIKLYNTNDYGKELIIKVCTAGDFIGYSALIQKKPYHLSAAALESSEVYLIPQQDFQQLLYANKDVSAQLIKMLADNVIEKEGQLLSLAYHSVRKRVANALLSLCDPEQAQPKIYIRREDLAQIVGTAKESVIRMLTEFRKDKFIKIQGSYILVLDQDGLRDVPG